MDRSLNELFCANTLEDPFSDLYAIQDSIMAPFLDARDAVRYPIDIAIDRILSIRSTISEAINTVIALSENIRENL